MRDLDEESRKKITNFWKEGIDSFHTVTDTLSTTVSWCAPDSEENFNKTPHPYYTKTSISYTYNSRGFRTHEFDFKNTENNILCFGCSFTEGIGVINPWPVVLEKKLLPYKVYNLGHSGGSSDTVLRYMINYVPLLRPKKVFIFWPPPHRFENYVAYGRIDHVTAWSGDPKLTKLLNDENVVNRFEKNKIFAEIVARAYNFELYTLSSIDTLTADLAVDVGRDWDGTGGHPGERTHENIAERFLSMNSN